jgi:integrative and conjugative element protein (TIGR02256 family)
MCFELVRRLFLKTFSPRSVEYLRPGGGVLRIGAKALKQMDGTLQEDPKACEAGGVLLGRIIEERPDFVVDAVTKPTRWDKRGRTRFDRAERPTQSKIVKAWKASLGERNYLGEWHTHPEDDPTPSSIDKAGWRRLARTARFEQHVLFFVIAGLERKRAWEVSRGGKVITELRQLTSEP